MDSVDNWAKKVKEGNWKKIHTEFVNSQFEKAEAFMKRLSKEKNGSEKIVRIYNIKNRKGYSKLLGE